MNRDTKAFLTIFAIVAVCIWAAAFATGCGLIGIKPPPSVCDNTKEGDSLLCDLAHRFDLHLETAGNFLMAANMRAIKIGAYNKMNARAAFTALKNVVNMEGEVSGIDLKMTVDAYIQEFPELLIAAPYVGYLNTPEVIREKDKELLNSWLDQQIGYLE